MINFPSSPTDGQVVTEGYKTWVWVAATGTWDLQATVDKFVSDVAASAAAATAARTSAEAARDAALAAAAIYPTTAAGLAATTSGGYFYVPSTDGNESLILYQDNAGTAVEQKRYPNSTAVQELQGVVRPDSSKPARLFEFLDKFRRVVAYIDTLNTLTVASIKAVRGYAVGGAGRLVADDPNPDTYFAVRDQSRRTYFSVGKGGVRAGKFTASSVAAGTVNGLPPGSYARLFGSNGLTLDNTDREIVASNGQSLSIGVGASDGANGVPIAITTDQPYGNLMFPKGPRFWDGGTDLSALVPHIEQATIEGGETILGGFQAMLAQLFNHLGTPPLDNRLKTIAIAPGQGATAIALLRQGGGLFQRYMDAVSAAVSLSSGKVVKSRGHFWLQGESDGDTDSATYIASLIALAGEVDAGVRARTGQTEPVITFTYQHGGMGMYRTSEAAKQSALVKVATPIYWAEVNGLVGANFDNVHRSAKGYAMIGACFAVAWFSEYILRKPWRPLSLSKDARGRLNCRVVGADLIVKFDVPFGGALAFDNGTFPRPNRGFYLFASDGTTAKPITEAQIEGRDEVRLVGAAPASGDILRVGFTDPAGDDGFVNLRDTQGDTIKFNDLADVPIHNWAIGEQHILTAQELS